MNSTDTIVLAILAKDKSHVLPYFLQALERQTWPKEKTILYVRTNNNNDDTTDVLRRWLSRQTGYAEIRFDDSDVPEPVQNFGQHEWNVTRFKVLGKIRQESMQFAAERDAHYVVVDCDNFLSPTAVEKMVEAVEFLGSRERGAIVAPLLHSSSHYSNYHAAIDANGYFAPAVHYELLRNRTCRGLVQVPVVHCTYAVHAKSIPLLTYDDGTGRYEYVIFSDSARSHQVPQYLDTRAIYGHITFAEDRKTLLQEPWFSIYDGENLGAEFQRIYRDGEWTFGRFPRSGSGSSIEATNEYRAIIQPWIDRSARIVDLGCGDWTFSQHIDWTGHNYLGLDVVPELIDSHNIRFAEPHIHFSCVDFAHHPEAIPDADLYIIKDVLQHWPNYLITQFLRELVKRNAPIVVTNCMSDEEMDDVPLGGFRPLGPDVLPLSAFSPRVLARYGTKAVCVIEPGAQ